MATTPRRVTRDCFCCFFHGQFVLQVCNDHHVHLSISVPPASLEPQVESTAPAPLRGYANFGLRNQASPRSLLPIPPHQPPHSHWVGQWRPPWRRLWLRFAAVQSSQGRGIGICNAEPTPLRTRQFGAAEGWSTLFRPTETNIASRDPFAFRKTPPGLMMRPSGKKRRI